MFYLTRGKGRIKKEILEILRRISGILSRRRRSRSRACNFAFPRATFKSTPSDLLRIITIEPDADRAAWPPCDNTDITSRYHSSADKASGSPKSPAEGEAAETETPRTCASQWRDGPTSKGSFRRKIFIYFCWFRISGEGEFFQSPQG